MMDRSCPHACQQVSHYAGGNEPFGNGNGDASVGSWIGGSAGHKIDIEVDLEVAMDDAYWIGVFPRFHTR